MTPPLLTQTSWASLMALPASLSHISQSGASHMALVSEDAEVVARCLAEGRPVPPATHLAGLVTIEDVIEEMIGEEVLDETDHGEPTQSDSDGMLMSPFFSH